MHPQGYKLNGPPPGMDKEENRLLMQQLSISMNDARPCYNPGCGILTISNSHVLQRRGGMLESIATNGFVMERSPGTPFFPRQFVRKGIKGSDVLAFVGFCNDKNGGISCDAKIFDEIEGNNTPDFNNYWHNLLFAYRAHLCLMHKGRAWSDAYAKVAARKDATMVAKSINNTFQAKYRGSLVLLEYLKNLYESEVYGDRANAVNNFQFTHVELPHYIELAACSTYGLPPQEGFRWNNNTRPKRTSASPPVGYSPYNYYFAIIPFRGKSHFIIGSVKGVDYVENIKISKIPSLDPKQLYKLINTLLFKRFDTWCVSVPMFEHIVKVHGLDYLNMVMDRYRYIYSGINGSLDAMSCPINLFEGII